MTPACSVRTVSWWTAAPSVWYSPGSMSSSRTTPTRFGATGLMEDSLQAMVLLSLPEKLAGPGLASGVHNNFWGTWHRAVPTVGILPSSSTSLVIYMLTLVPYHSPVDRHAQTCFDGSVNKPQGGNVTHDLCHMSSAPWVIPLHTLELHAFGTPYMVTPAFTPLQC